MKPTIPLRYRARRRASLQTRRVLLVAACLAGLGQSAWAEVIDIDTKGLQKLREQGVPVIDIRRLDEWVATGIIDGSHLMTFFDEDGNHDAAQWFEQFRVRFDPDKPVVLVCRSGVRSEKVTTWLSEQMNVSTVYNAKQGMVGWKSDGGSTVISP